MSVHNALLKIFHLLGYPEMVGLCHGFIIRWIEAVFLGEEEEKIFDQRIQTMIDLAKKLPSKPTEKEKAQFIEEYHDLLDLLGFFDSLSLYHEPYPHTSLFGKRLAQSDIAAISRFASSDKIEALGGLTSVDDEVWVYTTDELQLYLDNLANELQISKDPVGLVLSINEHTTGLVYLPNKQWKFMDINQYPSKNFAQNESILLAQTIKAGFELLSKIKPISYMATHTQILTTNANAQSGLLKEGVQKLKKMHQITPEIAARHQNGVGLAYIAAQKGEADVIAALAKTGSADFNQCDNNGATPAYIAAQESHVNVIAELAKVDSVNFNHATHFEGTPVRIATEQGDADVIAELAKIDSVDFNQASSNGITAAFAASQLGHASIIKILIQRKADFTLPFKTSAEDLTNFATRYDSDIAARMGKFLEDKRNEKLILMKPRDIAWVMGHQEVVDLIDEATNSLDKNKLSSHKTTVADCGESSSSCQLPLS